MNNHYQERLRLPEEESRIDTIREEAFSFVDTVKAKFDESSVDFPNPGEEGELYFELKDLDPPFDHYNSYGRYEVRVLPQGNDQAPSFEITHTVWGGNWDGTIHLWGREFEFLGGDIVATDISLDSEIVEIPGLRADSLFGNKRLDYKLNQAQPRVNDETDMQRMEHFFAKAPDLIVQEHERRAQWRKDYEAKKMTDAKKFTAKKFGSWVRRTFIV